MCGIPFTVTDVYWNVLHIAEMMTCPKCGDRRTCHEEDKKGNIVGTDPNGKKMHIPSYVRVADIL